MKPGYCALFCFIYQAASAAARMQCLLEATIVKFRLIPYRGFESPASTAVLRLMFFIDSLPSPVAKCGMAFLQQTLNTIYHESIIIPSEGVIRQPSRIRQRRYMGQPHCRPHIIDSINHNHIAMCWSCLGQGCPECMPYAFRDREPCPDCDDGNKYYIIDPETTEYIPCTREDYDKAPAEWRDKEKCSTCNGEGVMYD